MHAHKVVCIFFSRWHAHRSVDFELTHDLTMYKEGEIGKAFIKQAQSVCIYIN